ncbi:hypothetical protein L208DRAFT_1499476, partial [Tricholoma matsutake]
MVTPYLSATELKLDYTKTAFKFVDHVESTGLCSYPVHKGFVHVKMLLTELVPSLTALMTCQIEKLHKIHLGSHVTKALYFECHDCVACNLFTSVFEPALTAKAKDQQHQQVNTDCEDTCNFPPPPLTDKLCHTVVTDFCAESSPAVLQEAGCA